MNLVIHDISQEEWKLIENDYAEWTVISDNGQIRPCSIRTSSAACSQVFR